MSTLKVFAGDESAQATSNPQFADPRRALTLRQCFEQFLLPELQEHDQPSTISKYRSGLKHWESLTSNPPVGDLDADAADGRTTGSLVLEQWQTDMALRVDSPHTIRSYRTCLNAIFRRIGPYERGNPQAVGILARVPYCRMPRSTTGLPGQVRMVSADVWNDLYRCANVAQITYDRRVPGPAAFQCLLTAMFFSGPRTSDAFLLQRENFSLHAQCPIPQWSCTNEAGWLWFVSRKRCKFHVIPMHPVLRRHVEAIYRRRFGEPQDYTSICDHIAVFVKAMGRGKNPRELLRTGHNLFPFGGEKEGEQKDWQTLRKNVQAAAGIPPDGWYDYQDLRSACSMAWNRAHYPAGEWVLGHASTGVNQQYYTVGIPFMLEGLPKLDVPDAFTEFELS